MRKRRGMSVIDFLFFAVITVSLFWFAGNIIYIEFYNSRPDVRAEIQLRQCAEKVGSGNDFIFVELPVSYETAKLLKEEHYEVYKELKEKQGVIYKKSDK